MKDSLKVVFMTIWGLFSSLFAGSLSIRLSVLESFCNNFNLFLTVISGIVALGSAIVSYLFVYYKMKNEKRKFEEGK